MSWKAMLTEQGFEKVKGVPGVISSEKAVYPCMMPDYSCGLVVLTISEGSKAGTRIFLRPEDVIYAFHILDEEKHPEYVKKDRPQ